MIYGTSRDQRGGPMGQAVDAVGLGAGPNGLVASAAPADAGWDVVLLEAQDEIGGAVKSAQLWPGATTDLFRAFYPLAAASPVIKSLGLPRAGLEGGEGGAAPRRDPAPR